MQFTHFYVHFVCVRIKLFVRSGSTSIESFLFLFCDKYGTNVQIIYANRNDKSVAIDIVKLILMTA